MKNKNTTAVICCAGMGTRLGIGTTKALLDINGKSLIIRQLELLEDFDDIRLVVGYQAEKVIETVIKYRKDIMFVFNYRYETTGVAESLQKGIFAARENIVLLDGDVLINAKDFANFIASEECICFSKSNSTDQIYVELDSNGNVCGFKDSCCNCQFTWAGVAKLKKDNLVGDKKHVYELLEQHLPIKGFEIRSQDIDTVEDYEAAIEWFENGCR